MSRTFLLIPMRLMLAAAIIFSNLSIVQADAEALDPTFGNGGIVLTDIGGYDDFARDIALQPDGRIIVAGTSSNGNDNDFALARLLADGSLDETFGVGGTVSTDFAGADDTAVAIALQPDGRIIAAGIAQTSTHSAFGLVRYNSDGSLDRTFGEDGKVRTLISTGNNNFGSDIVLQPDGKILMSGYGAGEAFLLVRYNPDGSLDQTFANAGVAGIGFVLCSGSAQAVALQPDGKILVAGEACGIYSFDFALARFDSNGILDPTFDGDGLVITDFDHTYDSASAIAVQPNGKIILVGYAFSFTDPNSSIDFALARYNSDGSLDESFDADGRLTSDLGGWRDLAKDIALQPDGKLVVTGEQWQQEGGRTDFVLARYNTDGILDTGFGTDGKVVTDLTDSDFATSVALQGDGRILVAGVSHQANGFDMTIARYAAGTSTLEVALDVLPNQFPNRIDIKRNVCKGKADLPVAILSTPDFNARSVDPETLTIGDPSLGGTFAPSETRARDVDRDGDKDLWMRFSLCSLVRTQALGVTSTELVLTGSTPDGVTFIARDAIEVIGLTNPSTRAPVFIYPLDGQLLDYEDSYLFKVKRYPSAEGYLWKFFQNGVMVWENYRDEGILSGEGYSIHTGTPAHLRFVPGPVEIWVRAWVRGNWTEAAVLTIHLQPTSGLPAQE